MHALLILLAAGGAHLGAGPGYGYGTASDTTFAVPSGSRIIIESSEGDVEIVGGAGREARVLVDGETGRARVSRSGSVFRIRAREHHGDADFALRVPADVDIEIRGSEGDIRISDVAGGVTVQTVDGDIEVDGARAVAAQTVDGDIHVRRVPGPVTLHNGDGDIHLDEVGGPIAVESVDGDIIVLHADAEDARLSTVGGDVRYEGTVAPGGTYELATHDGDVTFAIPEGAGAEITVVTWDGTLRPSFPIELRGALGSITDFTLGGGEARVRMETFDGDIFLIRPGERAPGPEEE